MLYADVLVHWYNPAFAESNMSNVSLEGVQYQLDDALYYDNTFSYNKVGDTGADQKDFYAGSIDVHSNVIPESATLLLLGLGVASLIGRKR